MRVSPESASSVRSDADFIVMQPAYVEPEGQNKPAKIGIEAELVRSQASVGSWCNQHSKIQS